jgi:hypothetical protein
VAGAGLGYQLLEKPDGLPAALRGRGRRVVEVRTDRAAGATLRTQLAQVTRTLGSSSA